MGREACVFPEYQNLLTSNTFICKQAVPIYLAAICQIISFSLLITKYRIFFYSSLNINSQITYHTLHNNYICVCVYGGYRMARKGLMWPQSWKSSNRLEWKRRRRLDTNAESPCRWLDKMLRSTVGELLKGMELLQTLRSSWAARLSQTA